MKKEYAVKILGKFKTYQTVDDAVNAHGNNAVQIFEISTTSMGWFKKRFLFEKVEAPPMAADACASDEAEF